MKRISRLTDLSNDLFLEIFDYLDVKDLFQAFNDLNRRFRSTIVDRRICFQANIISLTSSDFSLYRRQILPQIGCYLRYLSISDEFNDLQLILRSISFPSLQFLRLYHVKINELKLILEQCKLKYISIDTNHIQNEKHLSDLFRMIFNQQENLRSIQCRFHTNLHFIEDKCQLSQLRSVTLDCTCFSSDFIILISQLRELRHLNARINDYNRESMDKDISHLSGSQSLRSLILHIEDVKLDRLLCVLSLVPNVNMLELNGAIDFDIDHLLVLQRNYRSFRCHLEHDLTF